jgi:ATP-dependent protease HslVU (ClpYQ) peptidase subunit
MFITLFNQRLEKAGGDVNKAVEELRKEWEGFKSIPASQLIKALEGVV